MQTTDDKARAFQARHEMTAGALRRQSEEPGGESWAHCYECDDYLLKEEMGRVGTTRWVCGRCESMTLRGE